jgi:phosphoribosylamine--glycine ligase
MKVLLIGSGGREDALAWGLCRSPRLDTLHCAPGNAGMARRGECIDDVRADDVDALADRARLERYDLVVVGPEAPLVAGLADRLREAGIAVFGPDAAAARIEGSKAFAKEFMARHGIPTASFRVYDRGSEAVDYLSSSAASYPLVVKADGLAAGKGVILCDNAEQATSAATGMLEKNSYGKAGSRIVIEEMLRGREASFFVLADGERFVELDTCQDYKRAHDGDQGPNTGGMGTYSPSVYLDDALRRTIVETIVKPTIDGLAADGTAYRGVLYVGVMLTDSGPKVLEYNARFGDPETQVLIPRFDGDWLELLHACATGDLGRRKLSWRDEAAVCVVMAAGGYPGSYEKGLPISGIAEAEAQDDVVVFHAGTGVDGETIATSGGRVLGVTALGRDLAVARERAYAAVARIAWPGEQHRTDIALDAVERLAQGARR